MKKSTLAIAFGLIGLISGQSNLNAHNSNNGNVKAKQAKPFRLPANFKAGEEYLEGTLLIKIKDEYRSQCSKDNVSIGILQQELNSLIVADFRKKFPEQEAPKEKYNKQGQAYADLSLIYELRYNANTPVDVAINRLLKTGVIVYAEPRYIHKPFVAPYIPNDPSAQNGQSQYNYLNRIKAFDAWGVAGGQGDSTVVIGIVDSGTDIDHPDLKTKFKYNYAEYPANGVDDDNDGFVDNYRGWDLAGADYNLNPFVGDNNPDCAGSNQNHGSHVSGCAGAATDNNVGVAGSGFKCKILPVKCGADNDTRAQGAGYILTGYEGIKYAADHGANVINCSWGGGGSSQYEQDMITYATLTRNSLIVAAAGNNTADEASYPAAYQYVISVASTNSTSDNLSSFSNYNATVDVTCTGNQIYNTVWNNSYTAMSGTSMASPVAAGGCGLIKAYYPSYNALQVGEKLRVTCDALTSSNANTATVTKYNNGKLGHGRVNLYKALTTTIPSVRMMPINITDNNDESFVIGDTLGITGIFTNYLDPTANCTAVLSTTSTYVSVVSNSVTIGALNTLATMNNNANAFRVKINSNAPANALVTFKITYTDAATSYSDVQSFDVVVNVDYLNVHVNDIATTVTSKGRLFYNGDAQTEGWGFAYKDSSMAYEGGLLIGYDTTHVSDNVRSTTSTPDNDFLNAQTVKQLTVGPASDFDAYGRFTDANAPNPLDISVKHKFWAWSDPGYTKFVIVEYNIKNTSTATINNLYAGLFADWDIQNYNLNKADADAALKLGYAYNTSAGGLYAGVKVLTNTPFNAYGIDNIAGGNGGIDMTNGGASDAEKYLSMLYTNKPTAGVGSGNDVMDVVSSGPFSVAVNDSVIVAFAILAGDDLTDLQNSATAAQVKYDGLTTVKGFNNSSSEISLGQNVPNPANGTTNISFTLPANANAELSIISVTGQEVMKVTKGQMNAGKYNYQINTREMENGIYFYQLRVGDKTITKKMTVMN